MRVGGKWGEGCCGQGDSKLEVGAVLTLRLSGQFLQPTDDTVCLGLRELLPILIRAR
jgi:hypothetical protein